MWGRRGGTDSKQVSAGESPTTLAQVSQQAAALPILPRELPVCDGPKLGHRCSYQGAFWSMAPALCQVQSRLGAGPGSQASPLTAGPAPRTHRPRPSKPGPAYLPKSPPLEQASPNYHIDHAPLERAPPSSPIDHALTKRPRPLT